MTEPVPQRFEFGPFRLDPAERLLSRDGKPVSITPTGFDILTVLVQNSGHLVEKETILREVWRDTFVEEANLSVHVSALRKVLGENGEAHAYIETVPRRGYRFIAPVRPSPASTILLEDHTTSRIIIEEDERVTEGEGTGRFLNLKLALAAGASAILGLIGVGLYTLLPGEQSNDPPPSLPLAAKLTRLTSTGNVVNAAISPDGKFIALVMSEASGRSLWLRNVNTHGTIRIVAAAEVEFLGLAFSHDGNNLFYAVRPNNTLYGSLFQMPMPGGEPRKILEGLSRAFTLSPDDSRVAVVRDNRPPGKSRLIIATIENGQEQVLVERNMSERSWSPAWSPDGARIAVAAQARDAGRRNIQVVAVNPVDGKETVLTRGRWADVIYLAWTRDGTGLLMSARPDAQRVFQIWRLDPITGEAEKVTNDLTSYWQVSAATQSDLAAAIQLNRFSNIWVAADADPSRPIPITAGSGRYYGLSWTPQGQIVYAANTEGYNDLWVMNADGTSPKRITSDRHSDLAPTVSPDGRFVVFASDRGGVTQLWRVTLEGSDLLQLTQGAGAYGTSFTPDSRWIVYHGSVDGTLRKISIDGGESVQLTNGHSARPAVSPDGRWIAFFHRDVATGSSHLALVPFDGGEIRRIAPVPAGVGQRAGLAWKPDGTAVRYVADHGGVANIWSQPLDGGPAGQETTFTSESIFSFAFSPDDKSLACSRGLSTSDVVLISW